MDPKDIRGLSLGAVWKFFRRTGLHDSGLGRRHKGPVRPTCIGTIRLDPYLFYSILFYSILPLLTKWALSAYSTASEHCAYFLKSYAFNEMSFCATRNCQLMPNVAEF
jgi:hypothetical protein